MIEQVEPVLQEQVLYLLEDIVTRLDRFWFALEYAYFLLKVGLALLGIYAIYRLFRYLAGFNRIK